MKKIMKRAFSILLAFAIAFGALQLVDVELAPKAAAEQVSGFYTYVVEDGEATIIDVNEKISGNAVIPSKLGGYPVTRIDHDAFMYCMDLTNITISNSVVSIGDYAFYNCTGLKSITIPNSVVSLGYSAFYDCTGLTSVTIGSGVTNIGDSAFGGCTNLTSIKVDNQNKVYDSRNNCNALIETKTNSLIKGCNNTIMPDNIASINYGAFSGCTGLTSLTIPDSVTSIDERAFAGCEGLTSMKVSSGNKTYDSRNGCNAIIETKTNTLVAGCASTVIPNTVTCINDFAFSDFTNIKSMTLPDGLTVIGAYAFDGCTNMESINIPDKVTNIGSYAFWECSALKEIMLPDSIKYIGSGAFVSCYSLEIVDLGNSSDLDLELGYYVFDYCNNIKKFIVGKDVKNYSTDANGVLYNKDKTGLIKYTAGADRSTYTVNSNTVFIKEHAFEDSKNLKSIVIPSGLMSVSRNAFRDCDNLTDVYFLGTESEWNEVYIDDLGNDVLSIAKIHFGGKIGDLDNDGQINSSDALAVLRFAVGDIKLADAQLVFADVNCDGSINSQDALHILRYAVGELTSFD